MRGLALWLPCLAAGCASPGKAYVEQIPSTTVRFEMVPVPAKKPFYLGKTEITWDEYEAFCLLDEEGAVDGVTRPSPPYEPPDRGWGRGKHPAMSMRRHAAEAYCAWLSKKTGKAYRLPTEEEWSFACRPAGPLDEEAWHPGNGGGTTHEVGTKAPNAFGLQDMLGNVWEYCAGDFAPGDPRPVLRGGSYKDAASCGVRQPFLESWSERDPNRPRSKWWVTDGPFVGFRVARSAP
ncbi:MAG TPA: SUMF1/EgtB/PvdO family nonheme iron enzyme [Planctomycetota bacterium]|jgi:formylglycine-generating enzyme required for sulfatase activity|nr:SUMF1/EgtB/PvdO family nonheme iron enzyme [Planctomycetota bacterium]